MRPGSTRKAAARQGEARPALGGMRRGRDCPCSLRVTFPAIRQHNMKGGELYCFLKRKLLKQLALMPSAPPAPPSTVKLKENTSSDRLTAAWTPAARVGPAKATGAK